MKKFVIAFALLLSTPIFAQITLEHTYDSVGVFRYAWVDSNEILYYSFDRQTRLSINIYSVDHSLYKSIILPNINGAQSYVEFDNFTRHLFNSDDKVEFLAFSSEHDVFIFNEDGDTIFSCLKCYPNYPVQSYTLDHPEAVINTPTGAKMFLLQNFQTIDAKMLVYSLPGKLPTCNTKLSVTDAPTIISSSSPLTSAYTNPSNGMIRVADCMP